MIGSAGGARAARWRAVHIGFAFLIVTSMSSRGCPVASHCAFADGLVVRRKHPRGRQRQAASEQAHHRTVRTPTLHRRDTQTAPYANGLKRKRPFYGPSLGPVPGPFLGPLLAIALWQRRATATPCGQTIAAKPPPRPAGFVRSGVPKVFSEKFPSEQGREHRIHLHQISIAVRIQTLSRTQTSSGGKFFPHQTQQNIEESLSKILVNSMAKTGPLVCSCADMASCHRDDRHREEQ
jgi:hypothetical protein